MIKEIKVNATYIEGKAPSKFDELLKQYTIAKEIADQTESTKQPLIDAMGEEKLKLIYKQLETIVDHLKVIESLHGGGVQEARSIYRLNEFYSYCVVVKYCSTWKKQAVIYFDGADKVQERWFSEIGIVTNWNRLGLYEKLESHCERQMKALIKREESKAQKININFNNMVNN